MSKFKVLKLNESILIQLGIFSNQFPKEPSHGVFNPLKVYYILFISASFVLSASVFVYQNAAQFTLALRTCEFLVGSAQGAVMLICFSASLSKIRVVHLKLQKLVDELTLEGI